MKWLPGGANGVKESHPMVTPQVKQINVPCLNEHEWTRIMPYNCQVILEGRPSLMKLRFKSCRIISNILYLYRLTAYHQSHEIIGKSRQLVLDDSHLAGINQKSAACASAAIAPVSWPVSYHTFSRFPCDHEKNPFTFHELLVVYYGSCNL